MQPEQTIFEMTPMSIEVLLWCYYSPLPYPDINLNSVQEIILQFLEFKLIVISKTNYEFPVYDCTDLGKAHVRQLCNLPLPKMEFIDHTGKIIYNW